jgi:glycosyltransferase involved in cell wall biosynthesis
MYKKVQRKERAFMQRTPRVTIGLPVYNGELFLAQAVDSILAQTYQDFELVISDNGSTDRTQAICEACATRDTRVRYHRYEQNRGAAWNFNNTFRLARGEYFKWQCHDDLLEPPMIEQCVDVLDREPAVVVCYPRVRFINAQGETIKLWADGLDMRSVHPHERLHHFLYHRNKLHLESQFGLFRSQAFATTGLMGTIPYSETILMAELALRGQFRELPEYTFLKRLHANNSLAVYSLYDLGSFLDPRRKNKVRLVWVERYWEFIKAVQRAQLPPRERLRCYEELIPLVLSRQNVSKFIEDVRIAGRKLLHTYRVD